MGRYKKSASCCMRGASFKGSPATVLANLPNCVTALPVTLAITIAAPALSLPYGDQFDRIISATAKVHRLPLVTKDANITDASVVLTIW
jgi:PIN domain nuclease of toxin-antitoxin system